MQQSFINMFIIIIITIIIIIIIIISHISPFSGLVAQNQRSCLQSPVVLTSTTPF